MYGLIHQAARSMVIEKFGQAIWDEILVSAGVVEDDFVSTRAYPDTQTLDLVGAIATRANLSVPDLLRSFGHYWIGFASRSHYAPVMRISGDTLEEFLGNLDRMHNSIRMAIPEARMPSFRVMNTRADGVDIAYSSSRAGLEPFVVGLLEGLMERFQQQGEVRQVGAGERGMIFSLHYQRVAKQSAVP